MTGKLLRKITQQLTLLFYILKKKKNALFIFQDITKPVKKIILLMITNEERKG